MVKKIITLQAFLATDVNHEYKGRLLGLVTEDEYAGLVTKPDLRRKMFSIGSKPLSDYADANMNIEDLRLVMTVSEKDGEAVLTPTLFVTNPLDMVSSIVDNTCLNMNGRDETYYIIDEEVTQ